MSQPFIGEIRMFGGNFAPAGWAFCDGSLLPISQNDALFNLIGTTYGGDGQTTFALPNLRSRVPMHAGNGHVLGEQAGMESVTLTASQIPSHTHVPQAAAAGSATGPLGAVWANSPALQFAPNGSPLSPMDSGAIGSAGSSQPHDNMLPFVGINFIISMFGIFPSQ